MGALERNPRRPTGRAQSCSRTQRRTSRPRSNLGRNRTTVATAAPLHSRRPDRGQCTVTQTFALQHARVGPGFNSASSRRSCRRRHCSRGHHCSASPTHRKSRRPATKQGNRTPRAAGVGTAAAWAARVAATRNCANREPMGRGSAYRRAVPVLTRGRALSAVKIAHGLSAVVKRVIAHIIAQPVRGALTARGRGGRRRRGDHTVTVVKVAHSHLHTGDNVT